MLERLAGALLPNKILGKTTPAGMNAVDPLSFAVVGGVVAIVALMAAFVPVWKGCPVDPQ
jgi:hypothetical protein